MVDEEVRYTFSVCNEDSYIIESKTVTNTRKSLQKLVLLMVAEVWEWHASE